MDMKSIFDTLTDFFLAAHGVFIRLQLKSSSYKKHAVYKFEQIRAWMITEVDPLNSITLFPNALKCAPCVSSFPFFFFLFFTSGTLIPSLLVLIHVICPGLSYMS
jgi:hypothetical protein